MKLSLRSLVLSLVLILVAVAAHADGALFSPYEGSSQKALDPSFRALADDPATASLLLVKANTEALTETATALSLDLGLGLDLKALRVNSYQTGSGSLVWSGIVADSGAKLVPFSPEMLQFDPTNSVMLVKDGNTITGNVFYNGELYKIRPLKSGGHAIVNVNFAALPPDHPAEYAHLRTIPMRASAIQPKANSIIRVMVHYTPSAASASGNISALIDLAVAGVGLAWMCEFMMKPGHGKLVEVLASTAFVSAPVQAVTLPTRQKLPKVRAFVELVAAELVAHGVKP